MTRLVHKTWETLQAINIIHFRWLKSHDGNDLHDIADLLAKEGAQSNHTHPTDFSQTKEEIKKIITTEGDKLWNEKWTNPIYSDYCRQTKAFFPEIDWIKIQQLLRLSKYLLSKVIQLVTGFNNMNHHTSRKTNPDVTNTCTLCHKGDETGIHLATECSGVDPKYQFKLGHNWTIQQLVALATSPAVARLLEVRGGVG